MLITGEVGIVAVRLEERAKGLHASCSLPDTERSNYRRANKSALEVAALFSADAMIPASGASIDR